MKYTISFPIWCLFDTSERGAYHDLDRVMRESVERGFNCLRVESGAGLIDFSTDPPRGVIPIAEPYPGFTTHIRQSWCVGGDGECDLVSRLIALFRAAKKYDAFIILSSWYYLHTCWYCADNALNDRLHAIPVHERFQYFAEALDHLIGLLRREKLSDRIAFAEILNEADGLNFVGGYGNPVGVSRGERQRFRRDHEEALAWLQHRNPDVLFAFDSYTAAPDPDLFPGNAQVWNLHSYYLWEIYSIFECGLLRGGVRLDDPERIGGALPYLKQPLRELNELYDSRRGRIRAEEGWYRRVWLYSQLDPARIPELEQKFIRHFKAEYPRYQQKIVDILDVAVALRDKLCPGAAMAMGEGCTYCGSDLLRWEEKCDEYWQLLRFAGEQLRDHGFLGATIRTCSGCEDPSWELRKDDYRAIHRAMLCGGE